MLMLAWSHDPACVRSVRLASLPGPVHLVGSGPGWSLSRAVTYFTAAAGRSTHPCVTQTLATRGRRPPIKISRGQNQPSNTGYVTQRCPSYSHATQPGYFLFPQTAANSAQRRASGALTDAIVAETTARLTASPPETGREADPVTATLDPPQIAAAPRV